MIKKEELAMIRPSRRKDISIIDIINTTLDSENSFQIGISLSVKIGLRKIIFNLLTVTKCINTSDILQYLAGQNQLLSETGGGIKISGINNNIQGITKKNFEGIGIKVYSTVDRAVKAFKEK